MHSKNWIQIGSIVISFITLIMLFVVYAAMVNQTDELKSKLTANHVADISNYCSPMYLSSIDETIETFESNLKVIEKEIKETVNEFADASADMDDVRAKFMTIISSRNSTKIMVNQGNMLKTSVKLNCAFLKSAGII